MLYSRGRGERRGPAPDPDRRVSGAPARMLLISLPLALGLAASACGAGSTSPPSASTPAAHASAAPASPAPTGVVTPIDPGSVPLVPDTAVDKAYTIGVPAGWLAEDAIVPSGLARRYVLFQGDARLAAITVRCQPGGTIADLSKVDAGLVEGTLHGTYSPAGRKDATVGGLQGQQTDYTAPLGVKDQQMEARVLYLQGARCAWEILLQTFGTGQLARYAPLFDAVLATFQPASPAG